jgi:signal peptidase I
MKKVVAAIFTIGVMITLAAGMYWLSVSMFIAIAVFLLLSLRWSDYPFLRRIGFLKTPMLFIIAVVLAIVVRLFFFGIYNVGSSSMRDTLVPGDYVWVNKLIYGPLLPTSVYDIPWVGVGYWLIKGRPADIYSITRIPSRLKGYRSSAANDVVVFNKPGTTEAFIKRCVAGPGDTLEIRRGDILVNGRVVVDAVKVKRGGPEVPAWKVYPGVDSLGWDIDNWGPYILPCKGMEIVWDEKSLQLYGKLEALFEIRRTDVVNGEPVTQTDNHTFKHDYYFMVGDNRHASHDSRFFGPVPDYDIIGKATFIIFSKGEGLDSGRRFLRGYYR